MTTAQGPDKSSAGPSEGLPVDIGRGRAADLIGGIPRPAKTPRRCEEAPGHVVMEDHIGKPMDIIVILSYYLLLLITYNLLLFYFYLVVLFFVRFYLVKSVCFLCFV